MNVQELIEELHKHPSHYTVMVVASVHPQACMECGDDGVWLDVNGCEVATNQGTAAPIVRIFAEEES
jgi:hypothetical protein